MVCSTAGSRGISRKTADNLRKAKAKERAARKVSTRVALQVSRPSDVSSLFHLSVVDEELQQELQALGAHDVSEIFSPPRFTDKCHSFRLLPGHAIDLETGWSLLGKLQKLSFLRSLEEEDPYVVTGSPLCGPFSALQGLN